MLYFKFERLLAGRDSRKIGNNTWLHAVENGIALRHFRTDLIRAYDDGRTTVRPYYSVTSMRRLYEWVPRLRQSRGLVSYTDPFGVTTHANAWLMLDRDGRAVGTDYTPPPVWVTNKRLATATVRAVVEASFDEWAARPVLGCACCRKWASAQVSAPLVGAALWAALTARDARVAPKCLWHSAALDSNAQVAVARRVLRDVPLAKRARVLKRVRPQFIKTATAVLLDKLEAA
jgi:hypothetical protein